MNGQGLTKKCYALLTITLLLAGCEPPGPHGYTDQDVRREVFFECLKTVPAGPEHTKYNDWSEVVSTCGNQAEYIAARGYLNTRAAPKVEKP